LRAFAVAWEQASARDPDETLATDEFSRSAQSLGGVIQSLKEQRWSHSNDGARWVLETVSNAETHLVGAATYTRWARFWPGAAGPFAQPMNEIPKVVFSNSLASADWGPATIVRGDLAAAVARLKQERPDGYLLAQGGVQFARSLVQTGLIDEYRLVVQTVILGGGERLFTMPLTIEPVSTTAFSRGAVAHVFAAHH
jgi:dihydrofolate reductase